MTKFQSITRRLIAYCLGLFILALGVSISVVSNLGVSPVSSIPYTINLRTGIDLGICTTVIFSSIILLQMVILGREFELKNLLQIFSTSIFGVFISFSTAITAGLNSGGMYWLQLVFCAISIVLIAIGVSLYVPANMIALPIEGLALAIVRKFETEFPKTKMGIDCVIVTTAIVLSFIFFGQLLGVREGTLFAAVGVGFCMKYIRSIIGDRLDKFLHGEHIAQ